jgi:bacteriocin-like protein
MNKESTHLTDKELARVSGGATDIVMPTATIIVMPPVTIRVKKPKQ